MTLKVPVEDATTILADKEFCEDYRVKRIFAEDGKEHAYIYLRLLCPLSYTWVSEGPKLPPPSYRRSDGTYTPNFYSLRGDICKTTLFNISLTEEQFMTLYKKDELGEHIAATDGLDSGWLQNMGIERGARVAKVLSQYNRC